MPARSSESQALSISSGCDGSHASAPPSSRHANTRPAPGMQRGRCCQQRGARHAGRAADHGDVAIAALVRGMRPRRRQAAGRRARRSAPAAGPRTPRSSNQTCAGCVAAAAGEEAGLERQQAERVGRRARPCPAPVSAFSPEGRSTASTGAAAGAAWRRPSRPARLPAAARCPGPAARRWPDPTAAGIWSANATPAARARCSEASASAGARASSPSQVTTGSLPQARRCSAASKPSPPLLPGPQAIQMVLRVRRERPAPAAPRPGRRAASACAAARRGAQPARWRARPPTSNSGQRRSGVMRCMPGFCTPAPRHRSMPPAARRPAPRCRPRARGRPSGRPPRGRSRTTGPSRWSHGPG